MTKVLIVDDDEVCRESAAALLSTHGFTVELAEEGRQAIALGTRFLPDVLLVDRMLGGNIDGIEVAEMIRQVHPAMKTIVITGYTDSELDGQIGNLPAAKCLMKPVAPERLIAAVEEAAERADDRADDGRG